MLVRNARRFATAALAATSLAAVAFFAAGTTPAEAQAPAASSVFAVDGVHSSVVYRILHMKTAYFYGRFNKIEGTVVWDEANLANSKFDIAIETASVDSNNAKRDEHLRGADFFNAPEFPKITFVSTAVTGANGKYELTGNLSLNGTTKEVKVPFEKTGVGKGRNGKDLIGGEAIFEIKRSEFGITYMPDGLGEDVRIIVSIEAAKQ